MRKKIVIRVFGGSCSGKSSVGQILMKKIERMYFVAHDKLKWQLSTYHRNKDSAFLKRLAKGVFVTVCKEGIPVLLECPIYSRKEYANYLRILKRKGYVIHNFYLDCPSQILLERYHKRIKLAKKEKMKISVRSDSNFLENVKRKEYRPRGTVVFDSSRLGPQRIASEILKTVRN